MGCLVGLDPGTGCREREGQRKELASPDPGTVAWKMGCPPCPLHVVTENRRPQIRPHLQELWTGVSAVEEAPLRAQTPRPGHSSL